MEEPLGGAVVLLPLLGVEPRLPLSVEIWLDKLPRPFVRFPPLTSSLSLQCIHSRCVLGRCKTSTAFIKYSQTSFKRHPQTVSQTKELVQLEFRNRWILSIPQNGCYFWRNVWGLLTLSNCKCENDVANLPFLIGCLPLFSTFLAILSFCIGEPSTDPYFHCWSVEWEREGFINQDLCN